MQTVSLIPNIRLEYFPLPSPALLITPNEVDFGTILTENESQPIQITMQNTIMVDFNIVSIESDDNVNFSISNTIDYPLTIFPLEVDTNHLVFHPTSDGLHQTTIIVDCATYGSFPILLTGIGYNPIVSDYPYIQSFDTNIFPIEWTIDTEMNDWILKNYDSYSNGANGDATGNNGYYLAVDCTSISSMHVDTHMYSLPFNLSGIATPTLSFNYWIGDAINNSELQVNTIVDNVITNIAQLTDIDGASEWVNYEISLSEYANQQVILDFMAIVDESTVHGEVCIDDIMIINSTSIDNEEQNDVPQITDLLNNYPNPFSNETTISFDLKTTGSLSIHIYNIKGQLIRQIGKMNFTPEVNKIVWDGRDSNGNNVSNGIYFYKMESDSFTRAKK